MSTYKAVRDIEDVLDSGTLTVSDPLVLAELQGTLDVDTGLETGPGGDTADTLRVTVSTSNKVEVKEQDENHSLAMLNLASGEVSTDLVSVGGVAVEVSSGNATAGTQLVAIATDDINLAAINTATAIKSDGFAVEQRDDAAYAHTPITLSGYREGVDDSGYHSIAFDHPSLVVFRDGNTTNRELVVVSSSTADEQGSGQGAWEVDIETVDKDGDIFTYSELTLTGQVEVILSLGDSQAVNKLEVARTGNTRSNSGVISIIRTADGSTAGVPDELTRVYAQISVGRNRGDNAYFRVPAGKTFYPTSFSASVSGAEALIRIITVREDEFFANRLIFAEFPLEGRHCATLEGSAGVVGDDAIEMQAIARTTTDVDVGMFLSGFLV